MSTSFYADFRSEDDAQVLGKSSYLAMIGSIMYIDNRTRSDIATAVVILSQYVEKLTNFLFKSVKRVFEYLKGTKKF